MEKILATLGVIAALVVITFIATFGTISTGSRGVVFEYGVAKKVINEWPYFVTPFVDNVDEYNVRTQKTEVSATASSKDLQAVTANIAVNFSLVPDQLIQLISSVGNSYEATVLMPSIQESVKSATAKYTAEEMITKRESIRSDIEKALAEKVQQYGIKIDGVNVTNFEFSPEFNKAIEAKVTAEQNALAQKNKLEQVKYEAEQRITQAKAEAESIKIQAEAVQSQWGADYVKLQWIEKVGARWNGQMPTTTLSEGTSMLMQLPQ